MDFLNVSSNVKVEKETDSLGGFKVYDADIYPATIKVAYFDKSASGANNITVVLENADGFKYTHVEYITSRLRKCPETGVMKVFNTYLNKRTNKETLLPGMQKMISLCELLTEKPLNATTIEPVTLNIRSKETGSDVPTPKPALIEWTGKVVHVGMLKVLENKREKVGDAYIAVADTRESNDIDKWFNEKMATAQELEKGDEPSFFEGWLKKNKGQVRDKTSKNLAQSGAPAVAGAPAAGTPTKLNFS